MGGGGDKMNKNYLKGARLERKLVNTAREKGMIAFRSAGSHSPIDVTIIDPKNKRVRFIQAKDKIIRPRALKAVSGAIECFNDEYIVTFEFIHKGNKKEILKGIKDGN